MSTQVTQPKATAGFIALISAVIISAILLIVATSGSLSGFTTRFDIVASEYKEHSLALADACVDRVLLQLSFNPSYSGSETVLIGSSGDQCQIFASSGTNPRTFTVQGVYEDAYTNLTVVADVNALTINSYQEVAHF